MEKLPVGENKPVRKFLSRSRFEKENNWRKDLPFKTTSRKLEQRVPFCELLKEWESRQAIGNTRFSEVASVEASSFVRAKNGQRILSLNSVLKVMRAWNIPYEELDRVLVTKKVREKL